VGKVGALVQQFLSQAVSESLAEAVAEIQPGSMTAALSVTPPGLARDPDLHGGHGFDFNLGTSVSASCSRMATSADVSITIYFGGHARRSR